MAKKRFLTPNYEARFWRRGIQYVAGIDEVGRGALAGPLVAAAVMFQPGTSIPGITDSKQLSPRQREARFVDITRQALGWSFGIVDSATIDRIGIQAANVLAFQQAFDQLPHRPEHVALDALDVRFEGSSTDPLIKGDTRVFSIAAASILAKVFRDWLMTRYGYELPKYGFSKHKGYGTSGHTAALHKHGLSPIHRRTFCHEPLAKSPATRGSAVRPVRGFMVY